MVHRPQGPTKEDNVNTANLQRDYELIVDASGSMAKPSGLKGSSQSRWQAVQESTVALAAKVQTLDPDGINVSVFSNSFKTYENTTADKVEQIFKERDPQGGTDLAAILNDRLGAWEKGGRKPTTFLVVTDGEPNDKDAAAKAIVKATAGMDDDSQLGISFIQIGNDQDATNFLKFLDDELVSKFGAKFDVVDTVTFEAIDSSNKSFTDVLIGALAD